MPYCSTTFLLPCLLPNSQGLAQYSYPKTQTINFSTGVSPFGTKDARVSFSFRPQCNNNVVVNPHTEEWKHLVQESNSLSSINRLGIVENDREQDLKIYPSNRIIEYISSIRSMLGSMNDGEISVSAYDTAWVALVKNVSGSGAPQFPSSLDWIAHNQLPDGSWGDRHIFSAHDRIINTLACLIALITWNIHHDKSEKGMSFIKKNVGKLEDEDGEHMPIGFEVAFPALIEKARNLNIQVFPDDSPILQVIYAKRNLKLKRIPKDIMHKVPTTLLFSLEGMKDLEWEKLLKLRSPNGSFLSSPSSTVFAFMHTKDENCLRYLSATVEKFNGGVPNTYPVDLFEHLWAVDRLQRLGISRYFQSELSKCVDYAFRYWTEQGISWVRNSPVEDMDGTAMGFRVLRLYGYDVSADVFAYFENGGDFFCFYGQSNQAITGTYNLNRASQLLFQGEKILEDAKKFSINFLREKQAANELLDKWIITKDLAGEVGYALDVPWYASLPRVETRFYLEHYGGEDDVWIGKTLYRMPFVNNNVYLELAILDYNNCQVLHQLEWNQIQEWYTESNLGEYEMNGQSTILLAYYLAMASIFEPERSKERIAWAKTTVLIETLVSYFGREEEEEANIKQRKAFVHEFKNSSTISLHYLNTDTRYKTTPQRLALSILKNLNQLSSDALLAKGVDIHRQLCHAWEVWLLTWQEEGDMYKGQAELIVRTINLCSGLWVSNELLFHHQYQRLSSITNKVCHQLRHFQNYKTSDKDKRNTYTDGFTTTKIESSMQELVEIVLCNSSDGLNQKIKAIFLTVAKTFYYTAYCSTGTINLHIAKVLFTAVL